ncbi:MAG: hypothetical protein EB032_01290 [Betaproteobacteria bacterium]|nr:hypothetical protein [Betaproteobacteria bacterium]
MPTLPLTSSTTLNPVNCWKCKHFATSWDPKMPYSCKLLGFKSQVLPSIQVMNSDGRPCFGFDPKPVNAAVAARCNTSSKPTGTT